LLSRSELLEKGDIQVLKLLQGSQVLQQLLLVAHNCIAQGEVSWHELTGHTTHTPHATLKLMKRS
jgi:hypothetical protein